MKMKGKSVMLKVVKFGGSSLASADQFKKVGNIIRADESRKYVVPSAPGKSICFTTVQISFQRIGLTMKRVQKKAAITLNKAIQ